MDDAAMSHDILVERLHALANGSLDLWDVPQGSTARLINLSENATYLVEGPGGYRSVLRVHREDYHTVNAIGCELAWMAALAHDGGIETPPAIPGRDGALIQTAGIDGLPRPRQMVMFTFIEGVEPDENADLVGPFEELGEIAARRPCPFHGLGAAGQYTWTRNGTGQKVDYPTLQNVMKCVR